MHYACIDILLLAIISNTTICMPSQETSMMMEDDIVGLGHCEKY